MECGRFPIANSGALGLGTSGKTASAAETLIYREAAICRFWEEPKLTVAQDAPAFLKQVKVDADKWIGINSNIKLIEFKFNFSFISDYRKKKFGHVLSMGTSLPHNSYDEYVFVEYLRICSSLFVDPSGNSLPPSDRINGNYPGLDNRQNLLLKSYFIPLDYSKVKDGNWIGVFRAKDSSIVTHDLTSPVTRRRSNAPDGVVSFLFKYLGNPNTGIVIKDDVYSLCADLSPTAFYSDLQRVEQVIDIEPPALKTFLTR